MKKIYMFVAILGLGLCTTMAHADFGGDAGSGCDTSPENPTAILALLGSTGAGVAVLRAKLAARRANKN